jgi:hypothetical protein
MEDVNDIYSAGGRFFKAIDIINEPRILTITSVQPETMKDGKRKLKLEFHEDEHCLLVNKTNAMIISSAYGSDWSSWVGRKIKLRCGKTTYQSRLVDCINVEVSKMPAQMSVKQQAEPNELNPPPNDDEIPF